MCLDRHSGTALGPRPSPAASEGRALRVRGDGGVSGSRSPSLQEFVPSKVDPYPFLAKEPDRRIQFSLSADWVCRGDVPRDRNRGDRREPIIGDDHDDVGVDRERAADGDVDLRLKLLWTALKPSTGALRCPRQCPWCGLTPERTPQPRLGNARRSSIIPSGRSVPRTCRQGPGQGRTGSFHRSKWACRRAVSRCVP